MPTDTELVQAIAVLARAHRSLLREYFPAALTALQVKGIGLTSREARAVLAAASTPSQGAKLTKTQPTAL